MKFVYFDCFSGISGDMILGALIDLGVPFSEFEDNMLRLALPVEIEISEVKRAFLRGIKINVIVKKHVHSRKFADIEKIIEKSHFSERIKENSLKIFKNLFLAESRVHGIDFDKIHLHEAGADDAIIDIVGACFLLEKLKIDKVYSSPLNIGGGWVKASHGILPVPAPAVGELLKNVPVYSSGIKEELVTPTGASVISSLAKSFEYFPKIKYEKVGYGAGSRDFKNFPNVLRIFYGKEEDIVNKENIYIIETNIDDIPPHLLGSIFDKVFSLGALDVFITPIIMKKNRLAHKLTILCNAEKINVLIGTVFKETTSIGVRYFPVERVTLNREFKKVKIMNNEIRIKVSYFGEEEINIQPEISDCEKLAEKSGKSTKEIYQLALSKYLELKRNKFK